jgi:flagellin-like protein
MNNKKGLTPVIAVILLLMMTVAAAGAAFFWFVRIQSEMQGGTESYSESLSQSIAARADVSEVDVMSDESLKIILRNNGNTELPLSSTTKISWILKDTNQNIVCNQIWNASDSNQTTDTYCQTGCGSDLAVKGNREIILAINNSSHECFLGGYANNTMFYFKIDFAGITATGGSFEKDPASS